jgi:hypothetical protein
MYVKTVLQNIVSPLSDDSENVTAVAMYRCNMAKYCTETLGDMVRILHHKFNAKCNMARTKRDSYSSIWIPLHYVYQMSFYVLYVDIAVTMFFSRGIRASTAIIEDR